MNNMSEFTQDENRSEKLYLQEALEAYAQHPFATLETYKFFNQKGEHAASSKEAFITAALEGNTPEAPDFIYPAIDTNDLLQKRDELTAMLEAIPQDEQIGERDRLARENITNRIHEIGIMLLCKMQSELDADDPRYEIISYQLGQNMREVYGTPEAGHWRGILGYRLSLLSEIENKPDVPADVVTAWRYVKGELHEEGMSIEKPYQPQPETIEWYAAQLEERIASSREAVLKAIEDGDILLDDNDRLNGEQIVAAARIALKARGADSWKSETTDASGIDTTQSDKTIYIPENRAITLEQFEEVVLSHEIDEHVMRRVNGDASGELILGGTGANGYLAWEEGNGKVNEGLSRGKIVNQSSAFAYYLSGGLALGLDGANPGRNFGQTFDLVWRMNYVADYLKDKVTGEEKNEKYQLMDKAVDHLNRIFRGTDGRVPGVAFTKDVMTYYLGGVEVLRKWDKDMSLPEDERKVEHELERSAKIDPLRPDHRHVAQRTLKTNPHPIR